MTRIRAGRAGLAAMVMSAIAACILAVAPAATAAAVPGLPQSPSWIGFIYFYGFGPTPAQAIGAAQAEEKAAGYKGGTCSAKPYESEYEGTCVVSFYIP